jgi:hypothetical protein
LPLPALEIGLLLIAQLGLPPSKLLIGKRQASGKLAGLLHSQGGLLFHGTHQRRHSKRVLLQLAGRLGQKRGLTVGLWRLGGRRQSLGSYSDGHHQDDQDADDVGDHVEERVLTGVGRIGSAKSHPVNFQKPVVAAAGPHRAAPSGFSTHASSFRWLVARQASYVLALYCLRRTSRPLSANRAARSP